MAYQHPHGEKEVEGSDPHRRKKGPFVLTLLMTVLMDVEQKRGQRQH
ncbi:hypothetical protein [Synechococcus sp. A15-127]|nr:hypothetical protein [Synechococcus sp. A15-127]